MDLRYLNKDYIPFATTCSGAEAIGQRILALLFAERGELRPVAGNCFTLVKGSSANVTTIRQLVQVGLADVMPTIVAGTEEDVSAEVGEITVDVDRITVLLSITVAGQTASVSTTI